jgi:hypothetical protein
VNKCAFIESTQSSNPDVYCPQPRDFFWLDAHWDSSHHEESFGSRDGVVETRVLPGLGRRL